MRTLDRYILKLFLGHLAIILAVLVGLYGLIEFLEKVDTFIENHAGLPHYLTYPLYKLPQIVEGEALGEVIDALVTEHQAELLAAESIDH